MSKSQRILQSFAIGIFVVFLALSCKQSTDSTQGEETGATTIKYTLTPFAPSQEFADAALESMDYRDGRFTFRIGGSSFQLGLQTPDAPAKGCANSTEGQHIHLIVDNMPYLAKYEDTFDYDIEDGEHHILAFLSRSYHESIKTRQAYIAVQVVVKDKSFTDVRPVTAPMLFYSRPKGAYEGEEDARRIMIDYYLINPDPSHRVRATINGEDHILATWQPYYIDGLPAGNNEITLTLIDANGQRVNTDLNPVTRKFTLNPEPPAE
jgi:hypothetical protein